MKQRRTSQTPLHRSPKTGGVACVLACLQMLVAGCAADRNEYLRDKARNSTSSGLTALDQENIKAKSLAGTTILLHQSRFYGYTAPNAQSCAGDAKSYIPFPNNEGLEAFEESIAEPGESIRPAFIKNVALDLTDASTESTANRSLACSIRPSVDTKPSKCATFDLSASDSIGLTLNGTVLLLGGTPEAAGTGVSGGAIDPFETIESEYALSLSPVGTPTARTTWTDLVRDELFNSGASTRPRPRFLPSATFNPDAGKLLYFGGSTKLSTPAAGGIAQPTADNWIFSAHSRKWTFLPTVVVPRNYQQTDRSVSGTIRTLEKSVSPRASFGYLPISGMAAAGLGDSMAGPTQDLGLEKLLIVGGVTNSQQGFALHDTYLFNPTFGPEEIDLGSSTSSWSLRQWVESYHTRRISNSQTGTQLGLDSVSTPNFAFNLSSATVDTSNDTFTFNGHGLTNGTEVMFTGSSAPPPVAPGGIALSNNVSSTTYTVTSATSSTFALSGINLTSTGSGTITLSRSSGPLQGALVGSAGSPKWISGFDWSGAAPGGLGGRVSTLTRPDTSHPYRVELDPDGYVTHPGASHSWSSVGGGGVPGFGAASVHPSITGNFWIHFGGTNCPGYLSMTPAQLTAYCTFNSSVFNIDLSGASPSTTNGASNHPEYQRAGIASAAGTTVDGLTQVIVGWGGVAKPTTTSGELLLIRPQAGAAAPVVSSFVPTGDLPPQLSNGQLVYSHITRKFYLFGGIVPSSNGIDLPQQPSDTWELEVTTTASAKWRRLNPSCWPNCPQARRSHRMAEVNYQVPAACTVASPCTYGIFMEGGTANGLDFLADRWMFDPSANSGLGHWLNVNGFPGRRSAAMATYRVTLPNGNKRTRSLMFGGETGLEAWPAAVLGASQVFLPPILGDTEIFDYDTSTWNRAKLFGRGFGTTSSGGEKFQITLSASRLSPPPLSGAMMVTRTHGPTGEELAIPEIYLFGGRKKDGRYADISGEIWKFCPQSTREQGNPPSTVNAACEGPVEDGYSGRWSFKSETVTTLTPSRRRSFLGAAAYDSSRDEIIVYGGRTTTATNTVVTQDLSIAETAGELRVLSPGTLSWRLVQACASSVDVPEQRYGHSLSYDSQNNRLILVGGVALGSGSAFVHELTDPVPEVWTARYIPAGASPECYDWQKMPTPEESLRVDAQFPPEGGLTGAASVFLPPSGYGSGSYLLQDQECAGSGPLATADLGLSKKYSGGVTIDLDRAQLGSNENLLLKLTYIPMQEGGVLPGRTPAGLQDEPVIHIHLINTGMTRAALMGVFQPRHLFFFDTQRFPHVIDKLSVLAERDGQIREEQLVIPLASASAADRIRIERVSGSAVLLDVSVTRMGAR